MCLLAVVTVALARVVPLPSTPTDAMADASGDERALVAAAAAGDGDAFGRLVSLHERAVFRTALAALGDSHEAEDAAQDAFVVAWQKLAGFRHQSSFRTWLLTIAWRKALDRRRRWRAWQSRVVSTRDDQVDPLDLARTSTADPETRAVSTDLVARAQAEIRRLSPKLRDALLLASSGLHSYDEIASLLSIPVGTVKWRVSEARRILAARLPSASGTRGEP